MIRLLGILLAVYLVYKLIKLFFIGLFASRRKPQDFSKSQPEHPEKSKIITKDEGEYVDFEEVDDV